MSEDVIQELLREKYKKKKEREEKEPKERDKIYADYAENDRKQMENEKEQAMGTKRARQNWIHAHAFKLANPDTQLSQTQSKVSIRSLSRLVFSELVNMY